MKWVAIFSSFLLAALRSSFDFDQAQFRSLFFCHLVPVRGAPRVTNHRPQPPTTVTSSELHHAVPLAETKARQVAGGGRRAAGESRVRAIPAVGRLDGVSQVVLPLLIFPLKWT